MVSTTESYFEYEPRSGYDLVMLLPAMNSAQWSDIEETGRELIRRLEQGQTSALLLDLSPLTYIGSQMVALIVRCWKAIQGRNGRLVVVCNNDVVRDVISLAGLTKLWPVVATRDDAIEELGLGQQARRALVIRILACLGLLIAVVGAALLSGSFAVDERVTRGVLYGGAAGGIFAGLHSFWHDSRRSRYLGLGVALASAAVAVLGFLRLP